MQIYNEKDQVEQGKIENLQLEEKRRASENEMLEPSPMLKEIKRFKEQPDDKWNNENINPRERCHSAKLSNCEKEFVTSFNQKQADSDLALATKQLPHLG